MTSEARLRPASVWFTRLASPYHFCPPPAGSRLDRERNLTHSSRSRAVKTANLVFTAIWLAAVSGTASAQPAATPPPVALTLQDALERALRYNLQILTSDQQVESARGAHLRSLSGLLPSVDAHAVDTQQTANLAAFGFQGSLFPGLPTLIGPFNVFDARVQVSQPLLDLSALHEIRRREFSLDAARLDERNARDVVTLAATSLYLQAVAGARRITAVRTQVEIAESLLKLATELHDAGVTAGIDSVRARVQVASQRQRLIAAESGFAKQKLQLARAIGLPAAQPIELTELDSVVAMPALGIEDAVQRAKSARPDYLAVLARVQAAEEEHRAAKADALPSVHASGDVGAIGATIGSARTTYSFGGVVRVPVFNNDRRGREVETAAALRARQAEAEDFAQQVESEVRSAFLDVQAAEQQLAVARDRVDLANQELGLARSRFSAGVSSNLEVIQAQDEVAAAAEIEISSGYAYDAAKATLARTLGPR